MLNISVLRRQKPDPGESPHAVGLALSRQSVSRMFAESTHLLLTHEIFADTAYMLTHHQGFLLTQHVLLTQRSIGC